MDVEDAATPAAEEAADETGVTVSGEDARSKRDPLGAVVEGIPHLISRTRLCTRLWTLGIAAKPRLCYAIWLVAAAASFS